MSYTISPGEQAVQNRALTIEDYVLQKKLDSTAAWYNPAKEWTQAKNGVPLRPETIYIGEKNMAPTWEEGVFDVARYRSAMTEYRKGNIDSDKLKFSPWLKDYWEDAANTAADVFKHGRHAVNAYRSAGGVVTSTDSTAINVIQILGEILGRDQRQYTMEQAVTTVSTPNLALSVDTWQGFTASQDVGESVEALVKKGRITRVEYLLKKDVGHIGVTDEAQLRADRDIFTLHVNHAVQDLRRIKAQKIAVELETATDVAAGDWAAYTGEHSTRDPVDDIGTVADTIEANGGSPNTIASGARAFRDFSSNTHIRGTIEASADLTFGNRVAGGLPGLPGMTWYIDNLKTNTLVTVYDKSAILLMQGPTRTAQYRNEARGQDFYITKDYNAVKIIDTSLIRDVTGVSA